MLNRGKLGASVATPSSKINLGKSNPTTDALLPYAFLAMQKEGAAARTVGSRLLAKAEASKRSRRRPGRGGAG